MAFSGGLVEVRWLTRQDGWLPEDLALCYFPLQLHLK